MRLTFVSVALAAVATTSAVAQCDLACAAIREPVCGSNNKTYSNACVLEVDACATKENITVAKRSKCDCDLMAITLDESPVCGSDGVTYDNLSELKQAQCRDGMIKLAKRGECGACETRCTKEDNPLCGSDGKTYSNECELKNAACKTPTLIKISNGACPMVTKAPLVTSNSVPSHPVPATTTVKSSAVSVALSAFTTLVWWAAVYA